MLDNTLVVIPARSGSKGVPNKNIVPINGVPLLAYSIKFAHDAGFQNIYISTDSPHYEALGIQYGAQSLGLRSEKLSHDRTKTVEVVLDLYHKIQRTFKYILVLQPTTPQRAHSDIPQLFDLISAQHAQAVVSVSKHEEPHPYKLKSLSNDHFISSFISGSDSEKPRQTLPPVFKLNGAYYLIETEALRHHQSLCPDEKTIGYVMDNIVNVDTLDDIILLEHHLKNT